MIVTVASYKGGVGKTTTSIHLAAYLQRLAPTLLMDGDGIRSATKWSQRGTGHGLPIKVIPAAQMAKHLRNYEHVVIDTGGNPSDEDFRELAEGCDLIVIPAEPETVATDGLIRTLHVHKFRRLHFHPNTICTCRKVKMACKPKDDALGS